MSGLAGLLAGHEPPGVYRWEAAFEVQDVGHTVQLAGRRFAYVDGWLAATKAEFLAGVGRALSFPETYGQNLDALVDCLRDLETSDPGVILLWDGWGTLARSDRRTFTVLLDIFAERSATPGLSEFSVLLRGDGPDVEGLTLLQ